MIRFACPICKSVFQSPEQTAGIKVACPRCGQRLLIPKPVKADSDWVARLVTLTLAGALLGFLGWLIWMFPESVSPPSGQRPQNNEQQENLAQLDPVPLVQEVESSQKETSTPLPPQIPPPLAPPAAAKKAPSDPPPTIDNRPPDLPSPPRTATEAPKTMPPPPRADREEADTIAEELVKASVEQRDGLLEKLRLGKGPEYTQALAAAIEKLSDEAKKKARRTLADRLTRFTAKTLLAYLGSENPELRRAAALAFGMKDDKDHISELIDLLDDPEPFVVDAAHAALKSLTGQAAASGQSGGTHSAQTRAPGEKTSPARPPMQSAQVNVPAANAQASRSRPQKKDDDLPDVSLVPPEETSTAVKAIIRANALALHSKSKSERIQAAQVLGGLGEAGKPARRYLCAAMLDPATDVRFAAADALKSIDPKMHYLAVMLATEKVTTPTDAVRLANLLKRVQKLEEDGEPLTPLVAYMVNFAASNGPHTLFTTALTTLTHIGRKDLSSYRVIASALTNRDPQIRSLALQGLAQMKHGKLAVPRILVLLRKDIPANRVAAIEALAALADESTEEIIAEAITSQRYHDDKEVRTAVETALNKLENKKQTP